MLDEAYTEPEPHFAQLLKASEIQPTEVYPQAENKDPNAVWERTDRRDPHRQCGRRESDRHPHRFIRTGSMRGGRLGVHPRHQCRADARHDPRIRFREHNINMVMDPGETKSFTFRATKPGVFPFYCTNFCSAMHQEMQGYVVVHNAGDPMPAGRSPRKNRSRQHLPRAVSNGLTNAGLELLAAPALLSTLPMIKKFANLLRREPRFLAKPLNLASRLLLLAAAVSIASALFFPLWKMHLVAPQYSGGLDLYIYSYKIQGGGLNGQHLVEINNLNHYIGMKAIEQADFLEMRWMPFVFGLIMLMILRAIVFGQMGNLVDLFAVYCYFGTFSIGSFWYRLYQYGHNLDPHAPMRITPFTPLLIGVKQIANFREYSFPQTRRLSPDLLGPAHRHRRLALAKGAARHEETRAPARLVLVIDARAATCRSASTAPSLTRRSRSSWRSMKAPSCSTNR